MKYKSQLLALILFTLFFFIGWEFGFSPIKESFNNIKTSSGKIEHLVKDAPYIDIEADYVTENQLKIDVEHYDLTLDLYPDQELLKGKAVISGKIINKNITSLDLNFYDNLEISLLELNGLSVKYERNEKHILINLDKNIPDTFRVKVIYEGTPERAGLSAFAFGERNNNSVVYNLNEPNYASTWFPCNDIPDDKALLDITIINDSSRTSVSNGLLVSTELNGSRKSFHWKTVYPISTYLICLYSAEYYNFNDTYISRDKSNTMEIKYYAFPDHIKNAKIDFEDHPAMIEFFSKTFGEYPFIKEKYGVAEFLWQLGAMEHQTITGIGSNFVSGRKFFEDVLVHELAHQWFGNAVGPKTWKDIWLNEGFASYCEVLYSESKAGENALQSNMLSKFSEDFSGTLYDPKGFLFSSTVYDKGAWVLHMLRWETGDSTFFKVMRTYFDMFKYKSASTSEFKEVVEDVTQNDFTQFFNQWIYQGKGIAELDYTWKIRKENENSYLLDLNIDQVQDGYDVYHFPLQIKLNYDNDEDSIYKTFQINKRQTNIKIKLEKRPNGLILDPNNWLLALVTDKNSYE